LAALTLAVETSEGDAELSCLSARLAEMPRPGNTMTRIGMGFEHLVIALSSLPET
jgi:hypothetical protein